jgi:hypothetical protein
MGPREKFKTANLKEAPVSENAPLQSQRQAATFTIIWGKKVLGPLYLPFLLPEVNTRIVSTIGWGLSNTGVYATLTKLVR